MKIVLDMMGSDKGSQATKEGARLFHSRHPEIELILVGKKEELADMEGFQIVEANDVLEMDMGALEVLRRKESSMVKAINYCAENGCDAVVSAGSTGAFLSASALRLKKIEGVKRPALVTNFPNLRTGGQVTILDIGASIRNTPEELVQFALMGTLYSQAVNGIKSPKVRLLSNGAEEGKGSEEGKAAYQLLKGRTDINFQGNEEPSKVLTGDSDVIVTSGYDGNVLLKSTEGASVRNPYFASDYRAARRHGIPVGAYHFFSYTSTAQKQAQYFLRHSRFSKGDLPPVLDVEPTARQISKMGGVQAMFNRIRTWLGIVQRRTGVRPILYVSQQFVNKYLPEAPDLMRDYMVWIARYGEYKPEVRLAIWQLCPDGRVDGIHGEVDINVFNGYHDRFQQFLKKETIK